MSKAKCHDTTTVNPSNVIYLAHRLNRRIGSPSEPAFTPSRSLSNDLKTIAFQILSLTDLIQAGILIDRTRIVKAFGQCAVSARLAELRAEKLERKLRQTRTRTKQRG